MTSWTFLARQGKGVGRDEWRLQWRSWGTWLIGLFFVAVVMSEHPIFDPFSIAFTPATAASIWADRTALIGAFLMAVLTVPFALDRVRRQRVAPVEFSKPFERIAYVMGKFAGAILPLLAVTAFGLVVHLVTTVVAVGAHTTVQVILIYLYQGILIALPPIIFAAAFTYCLSIFIRSPLVIIPLHIIYFQTTTVSQAAADRGFSWLSPVVRPEYLGHPLPATWLWPVIAHQALYLLLAAGLLTIAARGFRRGRFLGEQTKPAWWWQLRLPTPPRLSVQARLIWGGHVVAALLFAVLIPSLAMDFSEPEAQQRLRYVFFGLEAYLPLSGLLLLAGALARDKSIGTLDLVLSKPVNRWRLLWERLRSALFVYALLVTVLVLLLHWSYQPLPLIKAFLVPLATGLYLGLIGLTVANLTRNALAGYGAGILYWFFEAGFDGRFTAPFYLFIASNQVNAQPFAAWNHPMAWLPAKCGLLLLAMWLFVLNGWLLDPGVKKRRAFITIGLSLPILFATGWQLIPTLFR